MRGEPQFCGIEFEGEPETPFRAITTDGEFADLQLSFDGNQLVATRMSVDQPAEINAIAPGLTERGGGGDRFRRKRRSTRRTLRSFRSAGRLDVGGIESAEADYSLERCAAEHA